MVLQMGLSIIRELLLRPGVQPLLTKTNGINIPLQIWLTLPKSTFEEEETTLGGQNSIAFFTVLTVQPPGICTRWGHHLWETLT